MPVIQPGLGDVHIDGPLSNLSLAFIQRQDVFVADRAFPRVPVMKVSDKFYTYDRGMFNRDEMQLRAPGAESAGVTYTIGQDSYSCDVWGLHVNVADQIRANADSPIQLDREATELLTIKALIRREKAWAADFFTTGVWTGDQTGVAAAPGANQFLQWNDALSNPIEDVRRGMTTVAERTGFRPNRMVLGRKVYDALLDHPDMVGRVDRGQTTGTALVMRQTLAALFELDEILVMDGIVNNAIEGATNSHAFIGGKSALLLYTPSAPGLMVPSAGYTFVWQGLLGGGVLGSRISRFRMEHLKADRLEIEQSFDQKKVMADAAQFFATAVA